MPRNGSPRIISYLLAPIALAALLFSHHAHAQKPIVVSSASAPLTLSLTSDATAVIACTEAGGPQVKLNARAVSPGGDFRRHSSSGTVRQRSFGERRKCRPLGKSFRPTRP